ncbi:TPA: DEAD/DEAH box helicase [Streptococcus suis]
MDTLQFPQTMDFHHLIEDHFSPPFYSQTFDFDSIHVGYDPDQQLVHVLADRRYGQTIFMSFDLFLKPIYFGYYNQWQDYHYSSEFTADGIALLHVLPKLTIKNLPFQSPKGKIYRVRQEEIADQIATAVQLSNTKRAFSKSIADDLVKIRVGQTDSYSLIPSLTYDNGFYQLTLKIATPKEYVIRNVYEQILNPMTKNETVSFGKSTQVLMNKENFDPFSQALIDFIKDQLALVDREYYYNDKKRIPLTDSHLEQFIDLSQRDDAPASLQITENSQSRTLTFSKYDDIYLEGKMDDEQERAVLFHPKVYLYQNSQGQFCFRRSKPKDRVIRQVFEKQKSHVLLTHAQVSDILKWQEAGTISYEVNIEQVHFQVQDLVLFLDISDEEGLVIKLDNYLENKEKSAIFANMVIDDYGGHLIDSDISQDGPDFVNLVIPTPSRIDAFILEVMPGLSQIAQVHVTDALRHISRPRRLPLKLGVSVSQGIINLAFESDEFDIKELKKIMSAYRQKKRFYRLQNGERIVLHKEQLEEINDVLNELALKDVPIRQEKVPAYRMYQIKDLPSEFIPMDLDSQFDQLFQESPLSIAGDMASLLRPYQVEGVHWLLNLRAKNLAGILADDMGLGKSLQTIAYLASVLPQAKHPSLIVVPASLLYNWQAEFEKFAPHMSFSLITGNADHRHASFIRHQSSPGHIFITSYDYLRRDWENYKEIRFDTLVLDEAHYIKNHSTLASKAVKNLQADHRIALSGTPIENSLAELWSLFDFLMPGYLYTYPQFSKLFEKPIVKEADEKKQARLKQLVSPFIKRRLKKEVLADLPDKIEETYLVNMDQEERKRYQAQVLLANQNLLEQTDDLKQKSVEVLAMLTRLRQLSLDGRLIYDNIYQPSSKILATLELIQQAIANKEQVLVFSSFVQGLELLEEALVQADINTCKITGSTPKEQRARNVQLFQEGFADVFLISLKAGGTGLNLTAASMVIHLDPWWNISAQNQATDRAHRIGQEQKVTVYKMVSKGTIEEKILQLQAAKKEISDLFVENSTGAIQSMSDQEIRALFASDL